MRWRPSPAPRRSPGLAGPPLGVGGVGPARTPTSRSPALPRFRGARPLVHPGHRYLAGDVPAQAGAGSIYFLAARDRTGAHLDGDKTYRLRVPQPVPANLFWSVTAYDAETRSRCRHRQDRAALSALAEPFEPNADGRWISSSAPWPWSTTGRPGSDRARQGLGRVFRLDGPTGKAFDGSWKPGDFEDVKLTAGRYPPGCVSAVGSAGVPRGPWPGSGRRPGSGRLLLGDLPKESVASSLLGEGGRSRVDGAHGLAERRPERVLLRPAALDQALGEHGHGGVAVRAWARSQREDQLLRRGAPTSDSAAGDFRLRDRVARGRPHQLEQLAERLGVALRRQLHDRGPTPGTSIDSSRAARRSRP